MQMKNSHLLCYNYVFTHKTDEASYSYILYLFSVIYIVKNTIFQYNQKLELVLLSSNSQQHKEKWVLLFPRQRAGPLLHRKQRRKERRKGGPNQTADISGKQRFHSTAFKSSRNVGWAGPAAVRCYFSTCPLSSGYPTQPSHQGAVPINAGFQGFGWSNVAVSILLSLAIYRPRNCACDETQVWTQKCLFSQN